MDINEVDVDDVDDICYVDEDVDDGYQWRCCR